ncbi:hypothetical protein D3OALGB2SA_2509 [Olavius algarvensis associated proteobacterium Delta 3]|nr:hypothetical protein D3OALGB2SA_2509 [Olavius algarvensis associated proteobacterium Delta 3]
MAMQDAQGFMKQLFTDEKLTKKFNQITSEDEFFALASSAGFDFTQDEWVKLSEGVEARARAWAQENNIEISDELSDDQLEAIAGGGVARWVFGGLFGVAGGILGAFGGALGGGAAGAGAGTMVLPIVGTVSVSSVAAVAGGIGGGIAGGTGGAALGDLLGQWIENPI